MHHVRSSGRRTLWLGGALDVVAHRKLTGGLIRSGSDHERLSGLAFGS
jgi:hypothetical protein